MRALILIEATEDGHLKLCSACDGELSTVRLDEQVRNFNGLNAASNANAAAALALVIIEAELQERGFELKPEPGQGGEDGQDTREDRG